MRRKPIVLSSAAAVALVAAVTVVAWGRGDGEGVAAREDAAAPAATGPPGLTRTQLSRVVLQGGGPVEFKPGLDTLVLKVTPAPGGSIGWHSHPGAGVFLIDKGVATNYGLDGAPCEAVDIPAGQGYFVSAHPHHPHLVRNNGKEPAEATVYYFNVPNGQPAATPAERPKECPASLN